MSGQKLKIAVLMGGVGSEREISLLSGANITSAVKKGGMDVVAVDVTPDNLVILDDSTIDVFFLALHGEFGEDGQIQSILEEKNLKFTGSGSKSSRIAFNKMNAKKVFRQASVTVPWDICIDSQINPDTLKSELAKVGEKFVVKPINQGSSVGVEIIHGINECIQAAMKCSEQFGSCMIEEFISGKEITVGIVNGKPLPIIEIISKSKFYDYQAKYLEDSTEYLFDTVTDEKVIRKVSDTAVTCFNSLGCRHLARVDMILSKEQVPYVLEINTLPGFTSHSLLPMAAARTGSSTEQLCSEIIEVALKNF